jgi:hypothetical protein
MKCFGANKGFQFDPETGAYSFDTGAHQGSGNLDGYEDGTPYITQLQGNDGTKLNVKINAGFGDVSFEFADGSTESISGTIEDC